MQNEKGQTAVVHYQGSPKLVTVRGTHYFFDCKFGVALAWIQPDDLNEILSLTKQCCGGNRHPMFRLATESQVHCWTDGSR